MAKHTDQYTREERYDFIRKIDHRANKGGRITVKAYGLENIPEKDGFIMFPNHQGLYDVLAIMEVLDRPFSVVNKKEVKDVPFLKQVFSCIGALSIDREDIRQGMKVILQMAKEAEQGINYLIFPEGTRSRDPNNVHEFKGGSFKSATKAKCPIVPVALIDTYKAFDTGSIKKLKVQVHFLKPVLYEEYKNMKTTEIAEMVKERIEMTIKEYEGQI